MNEVRRLVNILNNQPVNIYKILADISSSIPATSRVVGGASIPLPAKAPPMVTCVPSRLNAVQRDTRFNISVMCLIWKVSFCIRLRTQLQDMTSSAALHEVIVIASYGRTRKHERFSLFLSP